MDIKKLLGELEKTGALHGNDGVITRKIGGVKPAYSTDDISSVLSPDMCAALEKNGISRLYQHQVDAIEASKRGKNVVLESPTASGKTLAFTVPMMETLLTGGTALMVYPMKAVAFDQRRQISALGDELGLSVEPYDGDTPAEVRTEMRRVAPPHILLTNPEYLHLSFLQWKRNWLRNGFLQGLRFLVFDESHEYRGYFGSHMSQIVRRFLAVLGQEGVHPKLFLATATCENPGEHARALTGLDEFEEISAKNAGRSPRHYVSVNHQIPDGRNFLSSFRARAVNVATACLTLGHSVLIYCPFVAFAEMAKKRAGEKAKEAGLPPEKIEVFHAGLPAYKKRTVQGDMQKGDVSVVFCTNALELGIDVGRLDGVVLAGFPDNVAAARQRIGRAGRSWDKDAFVLYYPMNSPLDRFFAANFNEVFDKPLDSIVIDPANEEICEQHKPFWRHELGDGGFGSPDYRLNIRGGAGGFDLVVGDRDKPIGNISVPRAFREAYVGAVLVQDGEKYRVKTHEKSRSTNRIILERETENIRTEPSFHYPRIVSPKLFEDSVYQTPNGAVSFAAYFCKLDIVENFVGYKTVHEQTGRVLDESYEGAALWHNSRYAFVADLSGVPTACDVGVRTLEQFLRIGAMFVVPADRHDTSTHSEKKILHLYENYPGGIGVARQVFGNWKEIMQKGVDIAGNCACETGCPNCIVPPRAREEVNKNIGVRLAAYVLGMSENPGAGGGGDGSFALEILSEFAAHESVPKQGKTGSVADEGMRLVKPGSVCLISNGERIVVGGVFIDKGKAYYRGHMEESPEATVMVPVDKATDCADTEKLPFNFDTGEYEDEE